MSSYVKSEDYSSRREDSRKRKEPERDRDKGRDDRNYRRDRDYKDDRRDRYRDDRRDDRYGSDRGRERDGDRREKEEEERRKKSRESEPSQDQANKDIKMEDAKENEDQDKKRGAPVDVEEALKKKKQDDIDRFKPVFLSKEERQKQALAKRAAEVEERQKKIADERLAREKFFKEAEKEALSNDPKERDRKERERRAEERRERERERERERKNEPKKEVPKPKDEMDAKEMELMKSQYLGTQKQKKRIIKPSEKFKFVFDWAEDEDTTKELNPLYADNIEMRPNFGRGFMGGIDKKEQIKDYQKFLSEQDRILDSKKKDFNVHQIGKEKAEVDKKLTVLTDTDRPAVHWTEKTVEEMSDRDWRIFKEDYNITTKGGSIPNPIRNWREAPLRRKVVDAIEHAGYTEPTPIQRQAIPIALKGRDLMGIAETGSGKTAAYLIPMLEYILSLPPMTAENEAEGPYSIVLAPTRELAMQIEKDITKFAEPVGIRCLCVVGGTSIEEQAMTVRYGVEIIVATPGRLNDLIESRYLVLNQCTYVVLDEADRMIDLGFEPQVNSVLDAMPVSNLKSEVEAEAVVQEIIRGRFRTTIMYSATMPVGVERLSRKYLRRPAYVIIGEVGRAVDRIEQHVEWAKDDQFKMKRLTQILMEGPPPPIIIFVNQKKNCDYLARNIEKNVQYKTTTLHSSRSQLQREAAIEGFKAGKYEVLIATDVAGRGLDVKGVTHVINYDMPKTVDEYTHRIGRTGRAGLKGLATSFIGPDDTHIMYDLKTMLNATNNFVPEELSHHPAAQYKPGTAPEKTARKDTIIYAKN